jgi:KTSC domain
MANVGGPPPFQYPNRKAAEDFLRPVVGDAANNLAFDLRTKEGRAVKRLIDDALTQRDKNLGYLGVDKYIDAANFNTTQAQAPYQMDVPVFTISEIPTSSTNYSRPRTVAAGYDPDTQTMTVVFRDGTFYNYYQVSQSEWEAFHGSYSKGKPWLNKGFVNGNQKVDGLFIGKPRGPATDEGSVNPQIRAALYRVSRATQQVRPPRAAHTATQKAPVFQHGTNTPAGTIKGKKRQTQSSYRKQYGVQKTTKGKP